MSAEAPHVFDLTVPEAGDDWEHSIDLDSEESDFDYEGRGTEADPFVLDPESQAESLGPQAESEGSSWEQDEASESSAESDTQSSQYSTDAEQEPPVPAPEVPEPPAAPEAVPQGFFVPKLYAPHLEPLSCALSKAELEQRAAADRAAREAKAAGDAKRKDSRKRRGRDRELADLLEGQLNFSMSLPETEDTQRRTRRRTK